MKRFSNARIFAYENSTFKTRKNFALSFREQNGVVTAAANYPFYRYNSQILQLEPQIKI